MNTLFLDLETFCEVPITHGTHAYASAAEVMLVAHVWNDEETVAVNDYVAEDVREMVELADVIVIHNSFFDRTVLAYQGITVPVPKINDTMAMALAHSLPGSLDKLCDVMRVPVDQAKNKDGKKLINLFCKPRPKKQKLRRATAATHPEEWAAFKDYARLDVEAMRVCYRGLPRWNQTPPERALWALDQKINDRGIAIDMVLAHAALRAAAAQQRHLSGVAGRMTDGQVRSARQRDAFMKHLEAEHKFPMEDLTKGTVTASMKLDLPDAVRELLEIRQQAATTSPAKYTALVRSTSAHDGRLRGTLQFCGASRTGRWGGRMFQPQNLPRPSIHHDLIDLGIKAMKSGHEDILFENVMELCASAIRGSLVAPKGKKLVISDLSNIEGRVLAWLAGEEWKVKAFAEFDKGIGHDIYVLAYSRAFGVTPEEVLYDKKHRNGIMRLIGKVMELALGYGGAVGAFSGMAENYGLELPEEEIVTLVRAWRRAHPMTTDFWYDIEGAVRQAIREPGAMFEVGLIQIDRKRNWLRIKLPSGRYLCYPAITILDNGSIAYDGVHQYTRQWEQLRTYGAKIVENIVQAVARDILAVGMKKAEADGYSVCLHVHDELITEVDDNDQHTDEGLSKILATNPSWTLGLPLAAAGFECQRYRKD